MFADKEHGRSGQRDYLGAQQSEFAVADYGNSIAGVDGYAFQNAASGGEWLGEDCMLVREVVGNRQEVERG
jgi:hypothetical protein